LRKKQDFYLYILDIPYKKYAVQAVEACLLT